jgi:hypothetical protein
VLLDEPEICRLLELVKAAFPRFGVWKYNNEVNAEYSGFALWGEFVSDPTDTMPRRFFVTFDNYRAKWKGHLTIGKHTFFWSSADFGDACLVDTIPCATLEDAIRMLKVQSADLFKAFSSLES